MINKILKEGVGWGFILWLIGYALGFLFYAFLPLNMIGWAIMPIGILGTAFVSMKKVHGDDLVYYFTIAVIWTAIAVICDYFLLVKVLNPADGYYKLDVYIYYALVFMIPLIVGLSNTRKK